jgi:hypothetical protein
MTQPKLREGAMKLVARKAVAYVDGDNTEDSLPIEGAYLDGAAWALNNLHKLLEPREAPLVNGKRVAIVEVEGE